MGDPLSKTDRISRDLTMGGLSMRPGYPLQGKENEENKTGEIEEHTQTEINYRCAREAHCKILFYSEPIANLSRYEFWAARARKLKSSENRHASNTHRKIRSADLSMKIVFLPYRDHSVRVQAYSHPAYAFFTLKLHST